MKYRIETTPQFDKWFKKQKKGTERTKIVIRLDRITYDGNFGDFKKINKALYELRFFGGAGIRIYYTIKEKSIVLLLAGGDKSSQEDDIKKAVKMIEELGG